MRAAKLYILFMFLAIAASSFAVEYHGLVSVEDYYSKDSSSAYDFNIMTTRLRLDVDKMNKSETLSFHFDGRERNNLGTSDYSSSVRNERIDTANIEYMEPGKRYYLSLGRLFPKEMPVERVDGFNAAYQAGPSGMGAFGGMKPDPYTDDFNPDFTTGGVYAFYKKDYFTANASYVYNGYKGDTDRQYLYSQATYTPTQEARLFCFITADISPVTGDVDLTNAIAELSYRPVYTSGIVVGYNQFQAIRFYKSMDFDISNTRQQSWYIRGDHRFWNRYSIYGRYEIRSQYYQLLESELKYANSYQIGFRNDNLMDSGVSMDTSATLDYSFNSTHNTYRLDINRNFIDVLQVSVYGSYMENRYDLIDYTDTVSSYGTSGYLTIGKKWSLSLSYEGRQATDYNTNSVISRVSYRF